MKPRTVGDLQFCERPVRELLHLDVDRDHPSRDYTGVGWAIAPSLWLESSMVDGKPASIIRNAIVLALHSADDAEPLAKDIELEFVGTAHERGTSPAGREANDDAVCVLASIFMAHWLPRLPRTSAFVLALCNPHRAYLRAPAGIAVPLHYGLGDVASWRELTNDGSDRVILTADTWCSYLSTTTRSEAISRSIS